MKTLATALIAVVLAAPLSSCALLKEKYTRNEAATAAYLRDSKRERARLNVEGVWYSPQWGIVVLNQAAGKVTGIFQDYYRADGVVSGRKAHIALIDDDWTEYTVELKRKNWEELTGWYSSSVPFTEADAHELQLVRIGD